MNDLVDNVKDTCCIKSPFHVQPNLMDRKKCNTVFSLRMGLTWFWIFLGMFTILSELSDAQTTSLPYVDTFACDFETGDLCDIRQSTDDDFDWTLGQGSGSTDGPPLDHTTGSSAGFYVFTTEQGNVASLVSPNLVSGDTRCLEFFYYINGGNVGSLEVLTRSIDGGSTGEEQLWKRTFQTEETTWQRGLITIASTANNSQLIFKMTRGSNAQSNIALDDISLTTGLCPYSSLSCDFEDPSLCGYTHDNDAHVRFIYGSGETSSRFSPGPSVDHTFNNATGHYMFQEASGLRREMTARMVSPVIAGSADGSNCLILWYHMYGTTTVGTLAVFAKTGTDTDLGSPLWSISGNRGNIWRAVEMDLTSSEDFQVVIQAIGTNDYMYDIAFDDVMITGKICPGEYVYTNTSGVTCDFESPDICYYQQDNTDTADWIWQNGVTRDHFSGPDWDHTFGNELGFYMYFPGAPAVAGGGVGRIITPTFLRTSRSSCLEFWYHMYGNDVETLNVYVVAANYDELPDTPSWSQSGNQGNRWHRATVNFPTTTADSRIIFEGRRGMMERDDVAIDDVVLYDSADCPEFVTDVPLPTTRPQVVDDISCDFEEDFCNYVQATDDLFDWSRHQGPSYSGGAGPDVDHTVGDASGFYALMDCTNDLLRFDDRTRLISPLLRASTTPRCLQFYYYKYSTSARNQDFLNVYIQTWGHRLGFDPVWSVFGTTEKPEWMEGKVELPASDDPFQVVFEGIYAFFTYNCDIALDDINLQLSACENDPLGPGTVENVDCDFEDTDDPFCGYAQGFPEFNMADKIDWMIGSGRTPSEGTGPENDHTLGTSLGHYMYIEASLPQRPNDNAAIMSPLLKVSLDHMCLQFYYHMSGEGTAWLRVLVTAENAESKEVARLSGQQESGWRPMLVDIPSFRGAMRVTFEGKIGTSYSGDIAIDDIKTVREPCGGFPEIISCDFELGFDSCMYDFLNTGEYSRWSWYDTYSGDGPVEGGFGSYMFSSSTGTRVASIKSNAFQMKSSSSCLMFDYTMTGESSLQVKTPKVFNLKGETGWKSYQITIEPSNDSAKIQFIATTSNSVVAVDNVVVLPASCNDSSGNSGTSPGIIAVIVLLVIVVVFLGVVLAVFFVRSRGGTPDINFLYKRQSKDQKLTSSVTLSEDPGVENPNYQPGNRTNGT